MDPVPTLSRTPIPDASLGDPRNFVNRELSTLAFLERILEEASDQRVSLLERLRFLGILSTSLDEFFNPRLRRGTAPKARKIEVAAPLVPGAAGAAMETASDMLPSARP